MKIAISTGGGDAPGLNAVIRAVVLSARRLGWDVVGIQRGFEGLFDMKSLLVLTESQVRGIAHIGGTILGTTNRGHPFEFPVKQPDGTIQPVDRSDELLRNFRALGLDGLISVGGDGSLGIAQRMFEKGLPVIGVPKTIDNDLAATAATFGFDTAVQTATEAIDKIHTTAESHSRVMVVEVMGRYAGWIALHAGLAGSAHCILIPEIPFSVESVAEAVRRREQRGRAYSIIVVAEGAKPIDGALFTSGDKEVGREIRLGGISAWLAAQISEKTGKESRSLVLGHLQRGGSPSAFDRLLGLRCGSAAVHAIERGHFGCMVALTPPTVSLVPLREAISHMKRVPADSDTVHTARRLGVSFGD